MFDIKKQPNDTNKLERIWKAVYFLFGQYFVELEKALAQGMCSYIK